jgi:hypothetical protein
LREAILRGCDPSEDQDCAAFCGRLHIQQHATTEGIMTLRQCIPPSTHKATSMKSALVDVGLDALSRGDWMVVAAVTTLIRNRGWTHD